MGSGGIQGEREIGPRPVTVLLVTNRQSLNNNDTRQRGPGKRTRLDNRIRLGNNGIVLLAGWHFVIEEQDRGEGLRHV